MSDAGSFTYIYRRRRWLWLFRMVDGLGGLFHRPRLGIPDLAGARSIVVLKLDQVGDLILTQPLLAALRKAAPRARIEIVVGKGRRLVVERFREIDEIREYPVRIRLGETGNRFAPWSLLCAILETRKTRPDVTVAAKEEPLTVLIAWLIGSTVRIGFREGGLGFLLTHTVPVAPGKHQAEVLAALAGPAGRLIGSPVFPMQDADILEVALVLEELEVPGDLPLVVVHPGAGVAARRWAWPCFDETMSHVSRAQPACFVVVQGEEDDIPCGKIHDLDPPSRVILMTRSLQLGAFAALLARAEVLLANESAPSHLAVAVGTPAVVPFLSGNDPRRWGPAGGKSRIVGGEPGMRPSPDRVAARVVEVLRARGSARVTGTLGERREPGG